MGNVVEATSLAVQAQGTAGQAFNVACSERVTLNDLVSELRSLSGRELSPEYDRERIGDVKHSLADVGRAREQLGYEPRIKFRDGLRRTLAHYEEHSPVPAEG